MAATCGHLVVQLLLLLTFISGGSSLDIAPIESTSSCAPESECLIDLSGLGPGDAFYDFPKLEIQLLTGLPVWTVTNRNTAQHFVGESSDNLISCDLIYFVAPNSGIAIITGRVHDRETDTQYEIKHNAVGQDTLRVVLSTALRTNIDDGDTSSVSSWFSDDNASQRFRFSSLLPGWMREYLWSQEEEDMALVRDYDQDEEDDEEVVIDMMVLWTNNAECQKSGLESRCSLTANTLANIQAASQFMIDDANVVFKNSETGVTLSLVLTQRDESGFDEGNSIFKLLVRTLWRLPYVLRLREESKADLVTVVVDGRVVPFALTDGPLGGGAAAVLLGLGFCFWLPIPIQGAMAVVATATHFMTPVHEWGHNLGCRHDRGQNGDCNSPKTFYGYRSPNGNFRTVMAYPCERSAAFGQCDNFSGNIPCPRIPYFSGAADWRNGQPMGGEDNSCRAQIRKAKKAVAAYK